MTFALNPPASLGLIALIIAFCCLAGIVKYQADRIRDLKERDRQSRRQLRDPRHVRVVAHG